MTTTTTSTASTTSTTSTTHGGRPLLALLAAAIVLATLTITEAPVSASRSAPAPATTEPSSGQWYTLRNADLSPQLLVTVPDYSASVGEALRSDRPGLRTTSNQVFRFVPVDAGYHRIETPTGLCVDVEGAAPGVARIIQWTCQDSYNQHWRLETSGDRVLLRARHSGGLLTVDDGSRIVQGTEPDGAHWFLEPAQNPAAGRSAALCEHADYAGHCQGYTGQVRDLHLVPVGRDFASSVLVRSGNYLVVYEHTDFQGRCQEFSANQPTLVGTWIGNDTVSSLRVLDTPGGCRNGDQVWITTGRTHLRDWESRTIEFTCPESHPRVGIKDNALALPFQNNSTGGVSASMAGGGYGSRSLKISFTNWAMGSHQEAGIKLACHHPATQVRSPANPFTFHGNGFELVGTSGPDMGELTVTWTNDHVGAGAMTRTVRLNCFSPDTAEGRVLYRVWFPGSETRGNWDVQVSSRGRTVVDRIIHTMETRDDGWSSPEELYGGCTPVG